MKHHPTIITLISVIILPLSGAICWEKIGDDVVEQTQFALKICDIAQKRNAQLNIVYRNVDKEEISLHFSEEINWNVLYGCLGNLPHIVRSFDLLLVEPERSSSSLSIFFITSLEIAQRVIDFLNPHQKSKQDHRYLFVWLKSDLKYLRDFFEEVWRKNILHAVAIVDSQRVYTFEPFALEGFRLKRIGAKHTRYFYDKLKNFHHYQVRITMFTDPARAVPLMDYCHKGYKRVDGWVARTLVNHLNATAIYITPVDNQTYGSFRNNTFTGSLRDIHSGVTHIGFNLRYTLDHVKPHVEELYPYEKRLLYLVVPAAKMRPEYMIFVHAFSTSLWRLVMLNFCAIIVLFMILQHLVEQLPNHNNQDACSKHWQWYELIEMFLKTQLGEPVEGFSRISSLRQFLIAWILFSYVLTSMYFAKLESSFVYPMYEPELDSLKDLFQLKVPIYAYDTVFDAIKTSLHPLYYEQIIGHSMRIPLNVRSDEFAFSITQKNENVALIVHDELAKQVLARTYNDETKRPSFHIVKEYLRSLTSSYVVTKGSPFIHKFQTVVSAFHEHGLIRHWMQVDSQQVSSYKHTSDEYFEDLEDDFDLSEDNDDDAAVRPTISQPMRKKKVVLSLDILQGAFCLWLGGILISIMGFVTEWWYWWRKLKRGRGTVNVLVID